MELEQRKNGWKLVQQFQIPIPYTALLGKEDATHSVWNFALLFDFIQNVNDWLNIYVGSELAQH